MVLVHDMDLHRAETAREDHLVGRCQVLVAEQQHLVLEEGVVDTVEVRIGQRRCQIDA